MKRFLLFIIFVFLIIGCHKRLPIKDYTLNDPRLTKRYPKYFTATTFVRYKHNVYTKVNERKANFFARFYIPENYDELKDFYVLDRSSKNKIRTDLGKMNAEIPLEEGQAESTIGTETKEIKDKSSTKSNKDSAKVKEGKKNIKSKPNKDIDKTKESKKKTQIVSNDKTKKANKAVKSDQSKSEGKLQKVDKEKKELSSSTVKKTKKTKQSKKERKTKSDKEFAKVEETKELKKREVKNTIDFEVPEEYIKLTELGLPDYYRTFLSDKNERVVEVLYIEKDLMFQFVNRRLAYVGEVSDLELTLLEKGYPQNVFIRNTKEGTNVITLIYTSRFGTMQKIYSISNGVREYYQEVR